MTNPSEPTGEPQADPETGVDAEVIQDLDPSDDDDRLAGGCARSKPV